MQLGNLAHHGFIDAQPPGGVDQQHIVIVVTSPLACCACNLDRLLVGRRGKKIGAGLPTHGLELLDGGRPIHVARHRQHFFLFLLAQPLGELADGGGLAGTLQTGHENDGRRLGGEIKLGRGAADELNRPAPARETDWKALPGRAPFRALSR